MKYELISGLETHVELATASKIFCGCRTDFGGQPNTHCCPVCTGQPGALPVLNKRVLEYAIRAGLATHCTIRQVTHMDRKNYVYPDLPKAYQISQFDEPICEHGYVELDSGKRIGITRIHIEEDAGKLVHEGGNTYIDYNRGGVPLIEIVSEPDISSSAEAREYIEKLQRIMRSLGVSDCRMQEGSMRCDVNISLRVVGDQKLGTRTEIKNMNSVSFIEKAMAYECDRQAEILDSGGKVIQATMRYDENSNTTSIMRTKEDAQDYRYFPEPDILAITITPEQIEELRRALPELPADKFKRYMTEFSLSESYASSLSKYKNVSEYFDRTVAATGNAKVAANLLCGSIFSTLRTEEDKEKFEIATSIDEFIKLVQYVTNDQLAPRVAQTTLLEMLATGKGVDEFIKAEDLTAFSDEELDVLCQAAIAANPKAVADFKSGKVGAINVVYGFVMNKSHGKADLARVAEIVKSMI